MQPLCTDKMKTARELLDFGVFGEGAESLVRLHDCARRAGCDRWHQCAGLIEGQWQSLKPAQPIEAAKA
jgi:hypothetical protein